jgi:hypothetical protein
MYGIKPDMLISMLRHVLTFIGGIIVARGWIDAEIASQMVGAIITLVGLLFSAFFHAASNGTIHTESTTPNMHKQITQTTVVKEDSSSGTEVTPSLVTP